MIKKISIFCIGILSVTTSNAQILNEIYADDMIKIRYGDVELADIDKDGDNDLIISGAVSSDITKTYVYKNNGNGYFSLYQSSGLPTVAVSALATGDIDSDGDLDLFVTGYWSWYGSYSELFVNNGSGNFSTVNITFPDVSQGESEFFDADNDGDLDLFYFGRSSLTGPMCKLFFNDGDGNFTESSQIFPPNYDGSLEIGDVNDDGFLDILMTGRSEVPGGTTQLWLNQGDGTFNNSGQSFVPLSFSSGRFIDLESDGDLDIVANGITNGAWIFHSVFYENDGLGNFTDIGNLGLDSLMNNSLNVADIDRDGDDDIFLSGRNANNEDTCALYLYDGVSFIKDTFFSHQGLFDGASVLGRMTNDCGIDLFYCGFGDDCDNESFLFRNDLITSSDCPPVIIEPEEEAFKVEYNVFSNPISDVIRVDVNVAVLQVYLYDERGRMVREVYQNDPIILLNVKDLAAGSYLLKFITNYNSQEFEEKFIKLN